MSDTMFSDLHRLNMEDPALFIGKLASANNDFPVFGKAALIERCDSSIPYAMCDVAFLGVEQDLDDVGNVDYVVKMMVLNVDAGDSFAVSGLRRPPQSRDIIARQLEGFWCTDIFDENTSEMQARYNECVELNANAPWVVDTRLYNTEPSYLGLRNQFPYYETIAGTERHDIVEDAASLEDVVKWLLENHPDRYFGAVVNRQPPQADSICLDPPGLGGSEFSGSLSARREHLKSLADHYGVTLGKFELNAREVPEGLVSSGAEHELADKEIG